MSQNVTHREDYPIEKMQEISPVAYSVILQIDKSTNKLRHKNNLLGGGKETHIHETITTFSCH